MYIYRAELLQELGITWELRRGRQNSRNRDMHTLEDRDDNAPQKDMNGAPIDGMTIRLVEDKPSLDGGKYSDMGVQSVHSVTVLPAQGAAVSM
jgi:hypothetical protein